MEPCECASLASTAGGTCDTPKSANGRRFVISYTRGAMARSTSGNDRDFRSGDNDVAMRETTADATHATELASHSSLPGSPVEHEPQPLLTHENAMCFEPLDDAAAAAATAANGAPMRQGWKDDEEKNAAIRALSFIAPPAGAAAASAAAKPPGFPRSGIFNTTAVLDAVPVVESMGSTFSSSAASLRTATTTTAAAAAAARLASNLSSGSSGSSNPLSGSYAPPEVIVRPVFMHANSHSSAAGTGGPLSRHAVEGNGAPQIPSPPLPTWTAHPPAAPRPQHQAQHQVQQRQAHPGPDDAFDAVSISRQAAAVAASTDGCCCDGDSSRNGWDSGSGCPSSDASVLSFTVPSLPGALNDERERSNPPPAASHLPPLPPPPRHVADAELTDERPLPVMWNSPKIVIPPPPFAAGFVTRQPAQAQPKPNPQSSQAQSQPQPQQARTASKKLSFSGVVSVETVSTASSTSGSPMPPPAASRSLKSWDFSGGGGGAASALPPISIARHRSIPIEQQDGDESEGVTGSVGGAAPGTATPRVKLSAFVSLTNSGRHVHTVRHEPLPPPHQSVDHRRFAIDAHEGKWGNDALEFSNK